MFYQEPSRMIPVYGSFDVVVLGSGPAGFSAAVAAARTGSKVLIVEQFGDIGGVATIGSMSHWTGNTEGGFYEEILKRGADYPTEERPQNFEYIKYINTEHLKTVMLNMLIEAGVQVLLYTVAADAITSGETVEGVIIENKSGRQAVYAKVVIDATGDGDIAARAGAEFILGRETDHSMQPMTLMFKIGGVDYNRAIFPGGFEEYIDVPKGEVQHLGKAHLEAPAGHVLLYPNQLPGVVTCNMTNCIHVDGTNADDLVKAQVVCRNQLDKIVAFLREFVPGYENCYLLSTAPFIGIRETRHFKGVQTLTEEDIRTAKYYENWVVTHACFNFDVHNMTGSGLDATGEQAAFKPTSYTIPYGCLVPERIEGLLLAGRNISGSHMAHSNYRVMPICANIGQAAGYAASLAIRHSIPLRDVNVKELQELLLENGVRTP